MKAKKSKSPAKSAAKKVVIKDLKVKEADMVKGGALRKTTDPEEGKLNP